MGVVFEGEIYRVIVDIRSQQDLAFVILDPWRDVPSIDSHPTYENFFIWNNISSVKVKSRLNDWYQNDEIEQVVAALAELSRTHRLIGFGGSMAAFGLINYADRMNLDAVLAFAPQFSIDERVAPYETRWRFEQSLVDFKRHRIAQAARRARGWLFYDPTTIDAAHAELINAHHDLTLVPLSYSNHFPMALLQQCRLLEPMLREVAEGCFDVSRFLPRLRSARRDSSWYWFHLSLALKRHGRTAAALQAARTAVGLPDWQPARTAINLADLLIDIGRFGEAIETLRPFRHQTDAWGSDVRRRLARWKDGRP